MTTQTVQTRATGAADRPHRPAQWAVMARLLSAEAVRSLLTATVVMLAVLLVATLVARWQGWQLVEMTETELPLFEVAVDADGVTVIASLLLLPAAVAIGALVMAVVLAARTRVYVATGATRRAVATGHLLTVLVMTGYTLLVTDVVLLVLGDGLEGARQLLGADGSGEVALLTVRALAAVVLALVAASAFTVAFLRWPWWVGVVVLALFLTVLPLLLLLVPALGEAVDAASAWWGWELVWAAVATAAYWWVMRRVPVR